MRMATTDGKAYHSVLPKMECSTREPQITRKLGELHENARKHRKREENSALVEGYATTPLILTLAQLLM